MIKKIVLLVLCGTSALATTHYVDLNSPSPTSPYRDWATAATNIQDAVDAAGFGDTVLVTNGLYRLTDEITVSKALTIQSVNGPEVTIVNGQSYDRCFYFESYATVLSGLTVTNGYVIGNGGGVYGSSDAYIVTNCIISGNSAYAYSSCSGGGMYNGTANNCIISGNSAYSESGNSSYASLGGGIYSGTANNCIISG